MWSQCWEIIVKGICSLYFSVTRERESEAEGKIRWRMRANQWKKERWQRLTIFQKKNGRERHLQSFNRKKKHLKQVLWQQHRDRRKKMVLSFEKSIISPVDPERKTHQLIHEKDRGYITTSYIPRTLDCVFHSWGNREPEDCSAWLHPFLSHLDDWIPQFVQTRVSLLDEEKPGSIHLLGYSVVRGMSLQWEEKKPYIRRDLVAKQS